MCKDVKYTNVITGMTTATKKEEGLLYKFVFDLTGEWNTVVAQGVHHMAVIPITGRLVVEKLDKSKFLLAVFGGQIVGRFRILRVRKRYEDLTPAERVVLHSEPHTMVTVASLKDDDNWKNCTFLIVTWDMMASSNPQAALNPQNYVAADEKKPKRLLSSCLGYRNLHYVEEV